MTQNESADRVALTEQGWAVQAHTLAILKQKPKLTTFFQNVCRGGGRHSDPQSSISVSANWPPSSLSVCEASVVRCYLPSTTRDVKCKIWILHPPVAQLRVKELCLSVSHFISYKMSQIITPHWRLDYMSLLN